jgi:hypothetical protein
MRLITRKSAVLLLVFGFANQGYGASVSSISEVDFNDKPIGLSGIRLQGDAGFGRSLSRRCGSAANSGRSHFQIDRVCQNSLFTAPRSTGPPGLYKAAGVLASRPEVDRRFEQGEALALLLPHPGRGVSAYAHAFTPRELAAIRSEHVVFGSVVDLSGVPIPAALWLFLSALLAPALWRRILSK